MANLVLLAAIARRALPDQPQGASALLSGTALAPTRPRPRRVAYAGKEKRADRLPVPPRAARGKIEITETAEDQRDQEIAVTRVAETQGNPDALVTGDDLGARLAGMDGGGVYEFVNTTPVISEDEIATLRAFVPKDDPLVELVADPKKDGIPVELQVQNRRPLSPAQQAKADARAAKAREAARAADEDRKAITEKMVMETKTATRKKTAKKPNGDGAKKTERKTKQKRADGAVRPGSKAEIIANMLRRKNGCTTAQVLEATGWPAVSMPAQAKLAGIKLVKEKDGKVTRYRAG